MSKAFLKAVTSCISSRAVNLGQTKLVFRWDIIKEPVVEGFVQPDFEGDNKQDRRNSTEPEEGFKPVLEADGLMIVRNMYQRLTPERTEYHEELHQNDRNEYSVDHHVPKTLEHFEF